MTKLRASVGVGEGAERVVLDGVELAFEDRGSGPALVCLHAIGHGGGDFAALRTLAGDRYRIVTLDWPGQGRSGPDRCPASAGRYAELLAKFLDARGIAAPILVGNSIGGAAAIRYAAERPDAVRALVLANPGGLAPVDPTARSFCRAMARLFRAGARGARWFPPLFALYYRGILRLGPARDQRARIVAAGPEIADVLAEAWESFAAPDADLGGLAASIRCPVLLAWATGDRIVSLARSRAAIEAFPDARLERFPGGHAPFLEVPEAFVAALERFTASLAPRSVPPSGR